MMHANRRWGIGPVPSTEELAEKLTATTWTLCTGFYVQGHDDYLFLNDATHEGGAGEYAAVKRLPNGSFLQVDSITFSWCDRAKALELINAVLAGEYDSAEYAVPVSPRVEPCESHRRCHLCA